MTWTYSGVGCLIVVVSALVTTPDEYNYNQFWVDVQDVSHIILQIRAPNDAHIILSQVSATPGPGEFEVREIVLGASGNTRSVLRNQRLQQDLVSLYYCFPRFHKVVNGTIFTFFVCLNVQM